jgi:hypothetical protein
LLLGWVTDRRSFAPKGIRAVLLATSRTQTDIRVVNRTFLRHYDL